MKQEKLSKYLGIAQKNGKRMELHILDIDTSDYIKSKKKIQSLTVLIIPNKII